MTVQEMIKKYNITDNGDGTIVVAFEKGHRPTEVEANEIRAAKPDILAYFAAEKAEATEKEAHTVWFYVTGWEGHKVSIDDRKDLDEQFAKIANYYAHDGITVESVRRNYENHMADIAAKAKKEIENLEQLIAENEGKELMTEAEYKAWRINYNNINNEGGEGYIPDCVTQEELQAAKERLAKIKK
jgi:hypothetical protein